MDTNDKHRDDEYLRSSILMDAYYALVGDPFTSFIDPMGEQVFLVAVTGISFGFLYWLEAPFLLI